MKIFSPKELKQKIPIDITYFTSFVDDYGNLHFRKDIYGYDRLMFKTYYKGSYTTKTKKRKTKQRNKVKSVKKKDNDGYEIIEIGY